MHKILSNKIFIALVGIFLISACSGKSKKDDFDLSGFIKPIPQVPQNEGKADKPNFEQKEVELKLIPLKDKKEISDSIKFGKKDPFSVSDNHSNKIIDDFKLKGFISLEQKVHALVEYKKQKGIINLNSVGGINTKMLPKKALVKEINPTEERINLLIEDEIYSIKLNS